MNVLETERLLIRQFNTEDADFILELLNDPSFIKNIGDRNVRTLEDAQAYLRKGPMTSYEKNGFGLSPVILKETGESIGMCGLIKRDALENVDIGYAFLPRYWAKGYAVESALGMKAYAKDVVGLKKLVGIVDPANKESIRVLEKIGLTYEKMIRLPEDSIDLKLFSMDL